MTADKPDSPKAGAASSDLVLNAQAEDWQLTALPILVTHTGGANWLAPGARAAEAIPLADAADRAGDAPPLVLSRLITARHLKLPSLRAYDLLELFAFVHPARFCLPTQKGLSQAIGMTPADTASEAAGLAPKESVLLRLRACAAHLLAQLAADTYAFGEASREVAAFMARAGWPWGPAVIAALSGNQRLASVRLRESGMAVWSSLPEWEDGPPAPPGDDSPVSADDASSRLADLLGDAAEQRPAQDRYSRAATHAFQPREQPEAPNTILLEAGTGTGKTLGYIAPASLWAAQNDAPVWLATFTKNLQRQLDQELDKLFPDPATKRSRVVVRKGRENYACLLNLEDVTRAVMLRPGNPAGGEDRDRILIGLVHRWARFSRDGDMIGGDFPSWLAGYFGAGRIAGLTDRRGECLYSACNHYRRCYVERASRHAKHADLVVANHALVISQAALRAGDPDAPRRFVLDEGHHLFDVADGVFALHLTGREGADLRRWLLGREGGASKSRARGLRARLEELIAGDQPAVEYLGSIVAAAQHLPSDGWLGRVQQAAPSGAFERFLMACRAEVLARADGRVEGGLYTLEAPAHTLSDALVGAAEALAGRMDALQRPIVALVGRLGSILEEEADSLDSAARGRIEAAMRSLSQRADMLRGWAQLAADLACGGAEAAVASGELSTQEEERFSWLALDRLQGRERDCGAYRHLIDPTKALAEALYRPSHGVLITSATLRDHAASEDHWDTADMATGAQHLALPPRREFLPSPFDYAKQATVFVVGDVAREDMGQLAAAYRVLFEAAGGGALGLFTAISRLQAVYQRLAEPLQQADMTLYAQHVDPIDTATLVDMFRADRNACLLGTDAIRDGVDVPGDSLRLIVMDRVPWPRPSLLHRARRAAFGGRPYDEMLARMKLAQAFGRLIRRASDRGVFVILEQRTPSRLLEALPDGVTIERCGLAAAARGVRAFLQAGSVSSEAQSQPAIGEPLAGSSADIIPF